MGHWEEIGLRERGGGHDNEEEGQSKGAKIKVGEVRLKGEGRESGSKIHRETKTMSHNIKGPIFYTCNVKFGYILCIKMINDGIYNLLPPLLLHQITN